MRRITELLLAARVSGPIMDELTRASTEKPLFDPIERASLQRPLFDHLALAVAPSPDRIETAAQRGRVDRLAATPAWMARSAPRRRRRR